MLDSLIAQLGAVVVDELNGVLVDLVLGSNGQCAGNIVECLVPADEGVLVKLIGFSGGIFRHSHRIAPVVDLAGKDCAIPVFESNGVVDVDRGIGCGVGDISGAIHNRLIPARKGVGVGVIGSSISMKKYLEV